MTQICCLIQKVNLSINVMVNSSGVIGKPARMIFLPNMFPLASSCHQADRSLFNLFSICNSFQMFHANHVGLRAFWKSI